MTDTNELARKMLDWQQKQAEADALAREIEKQVLAMGKSFTVGNVRCTVSKGTTRYETWEDAVRNTLAIEDDENLKININTAIGIHSHPQLITDWKSVAEDLKIERRVNTKSPPYAKLKLL